MGKRYVVLASRIEGDFAELNQATLREVGATDGGSIAVTSGTGFSVVKVRAGEMAPNQIKLPERIPLFQVGDRLAVEVAPEAVKEQPQMATPRAKEEPNQEVKWDSLDSTAFDSIMGLDVVKGRIEQTVYNLTHPEWFLLKKMIPPKVFLFFGVYGCGKTMLAKALASRLNQEMSDGVKLDIKLKLIKPTDIKDPYLGMSAKHIEKYLSAAKAACDDGSTVMLLLDEIDSLVATRTEGQTHEEYRDIVNILIQEIQGANQSATEARIQRLIEDPEVSAIRQQVADLVRKNGHKHDGGDISLNQKEWPPEISDRMIKLRKKIVDAGGVSTIMVVGTTNDPCHLDDGFISRAGDQVFFIPRPDVTAIQDMLISNMDSVFFDVTKQDVHTLAQEAFQRHLTGRDIVLSWMQPIRTNAPGALTIIGHQTVKAAMPYPSVGIEWELGLFKHLTEKGHILLANQVAQYLDSVQSAEPVPAKR